ncbi:hypothetical protein Gohar_013052 [Gossypium harknessii]|uniref:Uncharacterized protein n=1 Tax=Gossypium harknessii TaxID=34285 RepID=A0A7J9GZ37_9ROSI|nr:hypothetical protein [Gossypium harknessii]
MEEFESDSDEATEVVSDAKFLNTYKIMIEKWEMIYNVKSRLMAKNSELKEDNLKLSRQEEGALEKVDCVMLSKKRKLLLKAPLDLSKLLMNVLWRDKVLGKGVEGFRDASNLVDSEEIKEIEFLEGDVLKSNCSNGV